MQDTTAPRWLLVAGLLLGILMAASGVLEDDPDELPPQAIASINGQLILRDAWLRAVASVSSERRTPLTDQDRRHILERLIDEELLAQHGVALGLVAQDRRLRGQLVEQVLQTAMAARGGHEFSDRELRDFYNKNKDFFTPPTRVRVSAVRINAKGQNSAFIPPLPDTLLPPAKLRSYLGPYLTQVALTLRVGEVSAPVTQASGQVVLEMLERESGDPPDYEMVKQQVLKEMQRRADEEAVKRLLEQLREDNTVIVSDELQ